LTDSSSIIAPLSPTTNYDTKWVYLYCGND